MKAERAQVDPLDFEDLMRHCFDLGEDADVLDYLEERAADSGATDLCHELVMRLLPMINLAQSPLTKKNYRCFARQEGKSLVALVKAEVTDYRESDHEG